MALCHGPCTRSPSSGSTSGGSVLSPELTLANLEPDVAERTFGGLSGPQEHVKQYLNYDRQAKYLVDYKA